MAIIAFALPIIFQKMRTFPAVWFRWMFVFAQKTIYIIHKKFPLQLLSYFRLFTCMFV